MLDLTLKRVLVTGASGFLGRHVVKRLEKLGVEHILKPTHHHLDLTEAEDCIRAVMSPDVVIHLAGNVGGIGKNRAMPATLFYENLMMGVQLMHHSYLSGVEKFVAVGTVCSYPKLTEVPFREENLWNGYPEETNAPYGLAKKMLLVQGQAYRQQYDFNSIYLIPVNLYGPSDNFQEDSSHVIPALIKKVADTKRSKRDYIEVWGTGQASREFLYVEDAAEAIVLATMLYDEAEPVNIGAGKEITIKQLVETICQKMQFAGEIRWNSSYPDGQPRRCLDVSRAREKFGFEAKTSFEVGLQRTIDWYLANYG